ncbi:MAG: bifunctional [glutamine synthetase] adenylyltransferase/[glutamine synthetase]-adenylyl-L-tyrosine phosphorylase [Sphingomonas sp.]|uniref:bifunctional [glutamine synthetase] adenylyltransferase/[glutamine synthetase]-adenylyl-L-tyrosine phosphorylase n=1 Tax=Sphingomonas sp. TaxID=28214 RepID=UPI001AC0C1A9|nr:bifunctional [glutamine synthetase] adenylyltransferase/[glutamine synthetase]-adenylyl-L-tyrosine phosphorylase [Sphingomonas sp.]MBN8808369.1 bifunctional [glutamine synthetase] adenylyltransferase/[glutamine synthetase]-adenylyl-L-tyrosine phosphorylase [Sphingomonas sp.]
MSNAAVFVDAIARAHAHAPFLRLELERQSAVAAALAGGDVPAPAALDPAVAIGVALRRARRQEALVVAIADLAGAFDLTAVTTRLTAFADRALDVAIRAAIAERTPDAEPLGFTAIALGKQGSGELNYSSDIDPILLFDPTTLPCRPREEPEDAAVRIGRRVVELLQARDGEGYVLRVDLRLRPSPEVTPIVLPVDAAISYYESQALPWERAAFIRARAAAGDIALGQRFLDAIRPFVWRRSVDFGAVGEIRAITRRIRDHHAQGQRLGPGFDLKRGHGGIREIEFFAQVHQLVHGGRDASLRAPATRDALAALAAAGWIGADEAAALSEAYIFYRTVEHRLQMIDDRQTHSLPRQPDALDNAAQLGGWADGAALIADLAPRVATVSRLYDSLDPPESDALSGDNDVLAEQCARLGFDDAATAVQLIERWRGGSYPALRSPAARQALEAVLPALVAALGQAPDPRAALVRADAMLSRLPSAINFFRLLEARPPLAQLVATILSHAPPLADALGRRPELLDGLIDATAFAPVGSVEELAAEMARGEARDDYQSLLERARRVVGEKRFALGAQMVAGAADPLAVSHGYARVADAAIAVLAEATVAEFARAHGRVPDSELLILALGRLGGGALTQASDLDLIYLFTGDFAAESDGAKPLGAVHYYNRLAQRVTAALSVPTASGPLYEIDTRLRPSGAQGPLVVSLDGFARYQREDAWTWEHMALTRARPVFGSTAARAAVETIIADVLTAPRDRAKMIADATSMRVDMATHKPPAGPLDVKLSPGGLVDLEFAVHVLQLANGGVALDPDLDPAITMLAERDLAPAALGDAYRLLTRVLVLLRLVAPDSQPPSPPTRALIVAALGITDWDALVARLDATRQEVATMWASVSGGSHGGT